MKQVRVLYNRKWLCPLLGVMLFTSALISCKKVDDREFNKGDTPLALSVDKTNLVLKQKDGVGDALTFSWTSGTNKGTNAAISYILQIDKQGSSFNHPMTLLLGNSVLNKKFSVKDLNDSLLAHWQLSPDVETTLEAKITSSVAGNAAPSEISNTVLIKLKPYEPVTTTLYLLGDATPNGWSADQATTLSAVPNQPGKFIWQGSLKAGEFKFITNLGQFLPSYNKGANNNTLVYRTDNSQTDDKFTITAAKSYIITVDLLNLTIIIAESNEPTYKRLWIVGDATPNGWNIDQPNEMSVDSSNFWVFNYNEVLKAGDFKIPTSIGNWGTDFFMPLTNHPPISNTTVQLVPGGNPDNKWQITNPGPYKIRLDMQNNSISIKPFVPYTQIWMVGDATPAGWNINNPQPMTPVAGDPYKFEYSGPMNAGEFKFPLSTGDWGADYFMPVLDQSGPGSTQMKFVHGGSPDYKWRLQQAGNYKITIDQLKENISIVKL